VEEPFDEAYADRCALCGRTDVDDAWLWTELRRLGEEDCEFDTIELAFCSQPHAAAYLRDTALDWDRVPADMASGVRADRFMFGCGALAIVLSVIGLVAVLRWVF